MRTRVHRFVLSLLLLVLPLQTFASAAMLGCAFAHPAGTLQHALDMQATPDAPAVAMVADDACHESAPADSQSAVPECTHCAACYLTSALLIPVHEVAAVAPVAQRVVPLADVAFAGFIPDSPERPPRPLTA